MQSWVDTMKNYTGYMDHATKITLENMKNGSDTTHSGSSSSDGSAIGRIAPLLASENITNDQIADFIGFTHNFEMVKLAAIFFADVVRAVHSGVSPHEAIENATSTSPEIISLRDAGLASGEMNTVEAVKKFGQPCGVDSCLPGAIHCIIKYSDDFRSALIENAKAGGDSAARGMIIGMVLGASLGYEKLPSDWIQTMNYKVG
jgi:ADP-ribosylglycohydrolase